MGRKRLTEVVPDPNMWSVLILISIFTAKKMNVYAQWN